MSECCSLQTASLEVIHSIVQLNNVHNYMYVYLNNFVTLVLLNQDLSFLAHLSLSSPEPKAPR